MAISGFDLRQIVKPGRFEEFLDGRTSPYSLEGSLRRDSFVDEAKTVRPTVLLNSGNGHMAVGKISQRGDGLAVRPKLEGLLTQAKIQYELNHPNIVPLYAVLDFPDDGLCMAIRKHIQGDSLQEKLEKEGPFNAKSLAWMMYDMLQAVEYMQIKGSNGKAFAHRNIKPSNVFITDKGDLKITDFGLAKFIDTSLVTGEPEGARKYRAPEMDLGAALDKTDVWGVGVTCIEAALGYLPERIGQVGVQDYKLPNDMHIPTELKELLEKMVLVDYDERPTPTQAIDHLIEHGLVEDGLYEKPSVFDGILKLAKKIRGRKPKHKSPEEIQISRHLRFARTYARMRDESGMEDQIGSARYLAGINGKNISRHVEDANILFDNSIVNYGKQIIRNIVLIDGKTLEGLSHGPSGNDFDQIVPRLNQVIQGVYQRENLPLNSERSASLQTYFEERVAEEVGEYITLQLSILGRAMHKSRKIPNIGAISNKVNQYQQLAQATGATWDQEEVNKLVFKK